MDILTHTISGLAIGSVVATFSKRGWSHKLKIVALSEFAAALPDLDAISLWSGFDGTIGRFLHLSQTGKYIYSAKLWYSHHAFFHSLAAGILFALIIGIAAYLFNSKFKKTSIDGLFKSLHSNKLILLGFIMAYTLHLLEDMPTPASTWGGVRLLWPLKTYIGGNGDIWWWNNYDIFLIVCSVFLINIGLLMAGILTKRNLSKIVFMVLLIGFSLSLIQIKSRDYSFAYSGRASNYQLFELKSKEIQQITLGKKLYSKMEKFDQKLKIYF